MGLSQKDIAKMLGVTRVTVTRALSDSPLVSADLKSKIRLLCDELGYYPHYLSKSLSSKRTKTISVIRYDVRLTDLHSRWISRLQQRAFDQGYMIRLDPMSSFERILGEGSADGFIVFDSPDIYAGSRRFTEAVSESDAPIVFVDCKSDAMPDNTVSTDNYGGISQVMDHLIRSGHKRIAYLGYIRDGVAEERYRAYADAFGRYGLPFDPSYTAGQEKWAEDVEDVYSLREPLAAFLRDGVTAAVTSSDLYGATVIKLLGEQNLSVPGDLAVTGYDDSLLSRAVHPSLTTVAQDIDTASLESLRMVVNHIETGRRSPSLVVPAKLLERGSTYRPDYSAEGR